MKGDQIQTSSSSATELMKQNTPLPHFINQIDDPHQGFKILQFKVKLSDNQLCSENLYVLNVDS